METGSGGLKCMLDMNEGMLNIDAAKSFITIKVQGPNPVGLRGLLWGCVVSALREFAGIAVEKEHVVCGICGTERPVKVLRRKIKKGRFRILCEECDEQLPIDDLLPGALHTADTDPESATQDHKLVLELLAAANKDKTRGKFGPGKQLAWRGLLTTYLSSFLPRTIRPERAPPLLWMPQISPTGLGLAFEWLWVGA